jgi:hypothetical protein
MDTFKITATAHISNGEGLGHHTTEITFEVKAADKREAERAAYLLMRDATLSFGGVKAETV